MPCYPSVIRVVTLAEAANTTEAVVNQATTPTLAQSARDVTQCRASKKPFKVSDLNLYMTAT